MPLNKWEVIKLELDNNVMRYIENLRSYLILVEFIEEV